ncbi:hypothetical protein, partial [Streptomyces sclerotialus]|uniref:hypothetical protein n=1 Tax=Streptomyces sclerotialus TaxID=1957 RepID=UPI0004CC5700
MAKGPQRYPGASTRYWFQNKFPGNDQEVNTIVLHTTEGTSVPSYAGGSQAPNFTLLPDLQRKQIVAYQHFDFDRSSRALTNKPGGVQTNTLNVTQVELVGTCDPAAHDRWTKAGRAHVYWPQAPGWALEGLAGLLLWAHREHGVPLTGPSSWKPYPHSYGTTRSRMTASQWNDFRGICGHQHVPENDHGDPGSLDFRRILEIARKKAGITT